MNKQEEKTSLVVITHPGASIHVGLTLVIESPRKGRSFYCYVVKSRGSEGKMVAPPFQFYEGFYYA